MNWNAEQDHSSKETGIRTYKLSQTLGVFHSWCLFALCVSQEVSLEMDCRARAQSCWPPCSRSERTATTHCCHTRCTRCVCVCVCVCVCSSSLISRGNMSLYLVRQKGFVCGCVCICVCFWVSLCLHPLCVCVCVCVCVFGSTPVWSDPWVCFLPELRQI